METRVVLDGLVNAVEQQHAERQRTAEVRFCRLHCTALHSSSDRSSSCSQIARLHKEILALAQQFAHTLQGEVATMNERIGHVDSKLNEERQFIDEINLRVERQQSEWSRLAF
jgi:chromosome segregation ATPase